MAPGPPAEKGMHRRMCAEREALNPRSTLTIYTHGSIFTHGSIYTHWSIYIAGPRGLCRIDSRINRVKLMVKLMVKLIVKSIVESMIAGPP